MKSFRIEFYCNGGWEWLRQTPYFKSPGAAEKFIDKVIKDKKFPANEPYYIDKRNYRIICEFIK